jgi:hypothetical protein
LDAWKPELSKVFGIPESQVGKIVLPSFVAAKWISENEVLIDLESSSLEANCIRAASVWDVFAPIVLVLSVIGICDSYAQFR